MPPYRCTSTFASSINSRLLSDQTESLTDSELLEALLTFTAKRKRNNARYAKQLLKRFGTLGNVISEDTNLLLETPCMDERIILLFRLALAITVHLAREKIPPRTVISSDDALVAYCKAKMSRLRVELFQVFFLDSKNALISSEMQGKGTIDHVPIYPREIMKRALALDASSIILVHNHPSGDPTPSLADIQMTEKIISIAEPLGIRVLDHIIIGKARHLSFRSYNFLRFPLHGYNST